MGLKLGIVGCGYWGKNLIRNFIETDSCRLDHAVDKNRKTLSVIARRYPSLETSADYKGMLKHKELDGVVVATPPETHYRIAKDALLAGKHVLVEKPLANSLKEAQELVSLAAKKNRILMVDHTFLFNGAVKKIKEMITTGEIGSILYYDAVRVNLGVFQKDVNVLWDLAPHDLSIMFYLLEQEPLYVSAIGVAHVKAGVENIAYLSLKFKGNLIAHFHFNWLAPVKVRLTLIGGSEKMIVYNDIEASDKVKVYDRKVKAIDSPESEYKPLYDYRIGDMHAPKVDLAEPLGYMCKEFVDCILEKRTPISDGRLGLKIMRVLDAAKRSIKNNGKAVRL